MENNLKLQEIVENALKEGKSLLVQSLPGYGKKSLTKAATEKTGLTLAEFESTSISFHGLPKNGEKTVKDVMIEEEAIIFSLEDKKANVMLINAQPGENIDVYINAAKKINIPLIVLMTKTQQVNSDIEVTVFNNIEDMKPIIDAIKPIANEPTKDIKNVLEKMKMIRLSPEELAATEIPKIK